MTNFIQSYDPAWKTGFQHLKHFLITELKGFAVDIQHIGSTAIPGLCAKPILDIDIIISDKSFLGELAARLAKTGYFNKGEQGIPGRFAFRQTKDNTPLTATSQKWQTHHLYVCFADSLALKNHLLFRDALLSDKELVDGYAQLKKALMEEPGMTREKYTRRKTDFIVAVLATLGLEINELKDIKDANV